MLLRLPIILLNMLSRFVFYKAAEKIYMDPVLVALEFHRVTKTEWSSSVGSDDFVYYNFAMDTSKGYPAEMLPPVKYQNIGGGPVVPIMALALDVSWRSDVMRKTISEVYRDYRRYVGIVDDVARQPADVPSYTADDRDEIFTQEALWDGDGGYSFTAGDCSVIDTALARLSKAVYTLGSDFVNLVKRLVDKLDASEAATAKAKKQVDR